MSNEVLSDTKQSIYDLVTSKIIAMIEEGEGQYKTPWHVPAGMATQPMNAATLAEYRGINILNLWIGAMVAGYPAPIWASYRQWQGLGAQVRKGEKGTLVVFYKRLETTAQEEDDPDQSKGLRFVAKASWAFNASQVDGYTPDVAPKESEVVRIAEAEALVAASRAEIRHGLARACYRKSIDAIEMPDRSWFTGTPTSSPTEAYYGVLLHELTHWTGASHRLNREFGKRFGDEAYAMEELVAELGSAFLCAAFGISTEPRPDNAIYVSSWLKVLKRDNRAIFTAARKAQEAFEHLAYLATHND